MLEMWEFKQVQVVFVKIAKMYLFEFLNVFLMYVGNKALIGVWESRAALQSPDCHTQNVNLHLAAEEVLLDNCICIN